LGDVFAHHQEHFTVFTYLVVFTQVAAGWYPDSGHQPAATWVNTTRYSKYSQVLLMMDENFAQNM
jgi:hypothetical protein